MISIASTLLFVTLVFSGVFSTFAAPVGTRALDVATLRRMDATNAHIARREHHSARSVVPDDSNTVKLDQEVSHVIRRHHVKNVVPRHVMDAVPRRAKSLVPRGGTPKPRDENTFVGNTKSKGDVPRDIETKQSIVPRTEVLNFDKGNAVPGTIPEQPAAKRDISDGSIKPIATFRRALGESVKRDTNRGPIKPIAIFRRTLKNLD